MKPLLLSQRIFCLLDDKDYNWLHHWKWSIGGTKNRRYARRKLSHPSNGKKEFIYLHKIIAGVTNDFTIRFIDNNPLNLQRDNICIKNLANEDVSWRGSSGVSNYIGVKWDAYYGLWRAEINGLVVGYYAEEMTAILAYNTKAKEMLTNELRLNGTNEFAT